MSRFVPLCKMTQGWPWQEGNLLAQMVATGDCLCQIAILLYVRAWQDIIDEPARLQAFAFGDPPLLAGWGDISDAWRWVGNLSAT